MKKPYFGLVFSVATLASAIGSALPACAVNFVYGNVTYDVTTHTGLSFGDLWAIIKSPDNALLGANGYGNPGLAEGLAGVVKGDLGYPSVIRTYDPDYNSIDIKVGPYFAYATHSARFDPTTILSFVYASTPTYYGQLLNRDTGYCVTTITIGIISGCGYVPDATPTYETYATATVVPDAVPEPLTILGSITAAGFGVAFKRKKNSTKEE